MHKPSTDLELIAAVQNGDDAAFREIVVRYEGRIAKVVKGMLGDTPEAEDAGQETFIRFFKAIGKFKGESKLSTYLTRIAINLCLNEIESRKKRWRLFDGSKTDAQVPDIAGTDAYHQMENRELVQKGLNALEPEFRAVVVLRMIEGYSTKETAEMLKVPLGTVLSRLARAQKKLRAILEPLIK